MGRLLISSLFDLDNLLAPPQSLKKIIAALRYSFGYSSVSGGLSEKDSSSSDHAASSAF